MAYPQSPNGNSLSFDAQLQGRIEEFARAAGLSPSEVIRQAFDAYVASHNGSQTNGTTEETVDDVLRRSGLIGCLIGEPDSPSDLSTNPIHMEGFGRDSSSSR